MQKNHFQNYQKKPNIFLTLFLTLLDFIFNFYKFIYLSLRKVLPKSVIIGGFVVFVLVFGIIGSLSGKSENPKSEVLGVSVSESSESPKFANLQSQSSSNSSLENSSQDSNQSLEVSSQILESQNNSSLEIQKESEFLLILI